MPAPILVIGVALEGSAVVVMLILAPVPAFRTAVATPERPPAILRTVEPASAPK